MHFVIRVGIRPARILSFCLFLLASGISAQASDLLAWRHADTLNDLVGHLERWLDKNTDLPRRNHMPTINFTSQARVASLTGSNRAAYIDTVRGLYDGETSTVWLVRPWSARDPRDVSVLLHELVHHRQAGGGHYYCPGAQELPAYRIQQTWLAELGLDLDVNWIAIVLESGCTPRDIHPD